MEGSGYTTGADYHGGGTPDGYIYLDSDCSGDIGADGQLAFDNSTSAGFIEDLYWGGYINEESWTDPLRPTALDDPYNCRFVYRYDELVANNVQHYLLHCNLEENPEAEKMTAEKTTLFMKLCSLRDGYVSVVKTGWVDQPYHQWLRGVAKK